MPRSRRLPLYRAEARPQASHEASGVYSRAGGW